MLALSPMLVNVTGLGPRPTKVPLTPHWGGLAEEAAHPVVTMMLRTKRQASKPAGDLEHTSAHEDHAHDEQHNATPPKPRSRRRLPGLNKMFRVLSRSSSKGGSGTSLNTGSPLPPALAIANSAQMEDVPPAAAASPAADDGPEYAANYAGANEDGSGSGGPNGHSTPMHSPLTLPMRPLTLPPQPPESPAVTPAGLLSPGGLAELSRLTEVSVEDTTRWAASPKSCGGAENGTLSEESEEPPVPHAYKHSDAQRAIDAHHAQFDLLAAQLPSADHLHLSFASPAPSGRQPLGGHAGTGSSGDVVVRPPKLLMQSSSRESDGMVLNAE